MTRACLKAHPDTGWITSEQQSLEVFRQAAAQGCFICSAIWNRNDRRRVYWSNLDVKTWLPIGYMEHRPARRENERLFQLTVRYKEREDSGEEGPRFIGMRFCLIPCDDRDYGRMFSATELSSSTGSPSTLYLARRWYEDCRHGHNKCRAAPLSASGWLPTRLIDIGSKRDSTWRLRIVSEDMSRSLMPPYMTLSYRWGVNPSILLLSSNLETFRQGRPIGTLPKTFQEFIVVARLFSIRYIWIDSLCIIQDSSEDWKSEAPTMGKVYGNSACNIAASASADPNDGLFRQRNANQIRPGLIEATLASSSPINYYIYDTAYWDRHLFDSTLHKRGWVFQERFLAPRTLFFCGKQVLWECCTEQKCEAFPRGIPIHRNKKNFDFLADLKLANQYQTPAKLTNKSVELWAQLVAMYSDCEFTRPSDRLWAFSGIASLFQEASGDEYLAGLWRSRLLEMMDWYVEKPMAAESKEHRAPSWSWASLDESVTMARHSLDSYHLAEVLDVIVLSEKAESIDTVIGGSIQLTAPAIIAHFKHFDPGLREVRIEYGPKCHIAKLYPDATEISVLQQSCVMIILHKVINAASVEMVCFVLEADSEAEGAYRRRGYLLIQGEENVRSAQGLAQMREILFT
uniref:Heterokaryon incompatibility domain-containing protein n=1 Tax=Bionectria ochroleuca TaxID=29856 RepID=A0A0B7KEL3_BIOOC